MTNFRKQGEGPFPYQLTLGMYEDEIHAFTQQLEKYGDVRGRDYIVTAVGPWYTIFTKGERYKKEEGIW